MTIFHVFEIVAGMFGFVIATALGAYFFGWIGLLLGIPGIVIGLLLGRIPEYIAVRVVFRALRTKPTNELRELFQKSIWPAHHLIIGELVRRGEDVFAEFALVRPLLVSDDSVQRLHGLTNIRKYYPEFAARIPDYDPGESAETCREKLQRAGLMDV